MELKRRFLAEEHLMGQMPLLSKPGILFRTSFRPLELSKRGQGKETLILQSGPRLPSIQRW